VLSDIALRAQRELSATDMRFFVYSFCKTARAVACETIIRYICASRDRNAKNLRAACAKNAKIKREVYDIFSIDTNVTQLVSLHLNLLSRESTFNVHCPVEDINLIINQCKIVSK